ncbi:MAG TPA: hypothetical protein VFV78_14965 [Vicinamibacterales bacterium]|nr:hypothetical protein [Vicinamibacterales bacterium]
MRLMRNAALLALGIAIGAVVTARAGAQQALAASPQQPLCTLPGKVRYSPGAQIKYENQTYRCFFVWGDEMTPGVGWVKVEPIYVPKEPTTGR